MVFEHKISVHVSWWWVFRLALRAPERKRERERRRDGTARTDDLRPCVLRTRHARRRRTVSSGPSDQSAGAAACCLLLAYCLFGARCLVQQLQQRQTVSWRWEPPRQHDTPAPGLMTPREGGERHRPINRLTEGTPRDPPGLGGGRASLGRAALGRRWLHGEKSRSAAPHGRIRCG